MIVVRFSKADRKNFISYLSEEEAKEFKVMPADFRTEKWNGWPGDLLLKKQFKDFT